MTESSPHTTSSFAALGRLLKYARGYRRQIIAATTCSIINKLFDIAPEILIGIAIDVVVNKEESFVAGLGFETAQEQITILAVLTFFIWAGESIFEYLFQILWRNLAQRLQSDLRQDAYEHAQKLDMSFFEARSSGQLVATMNDDVNQLERFLDGGANAMIQVVVTVVAVGAVFFVLSPLIALLAFTPIPLIIWGAFYFQRKAGPLYADVREKVGDLSSRLANNLGGIATIKSFTAENREAERLKASSEAYVDANRRAIRISSAFIPVIRMAILAGFLATFTVGGMMAFDNDNREWRIAINVAAMKRVRSLIDVDLMGILDGTLLEKLVSDPVLLCDVVYCLIKPGADEKGVSDEDFGKAMGGDALEHATQALLEELADFFPQKKRALLRKALMKLKALEEKAMAVAEKRLDSPELENEMEAALRAGGTGGDLNGS